MVWEMMKKLSSLPESIAGSSMSTEALSAGSEPGLAKPDDIDDAGSDGMESVVEVLHPEGRDDDDGAEGDVAMQPMDDFHSPLSDSTTQPTSREAATSTPDPRRFSVTIVDGQDDDAIVVEGETTLPSGASACQKGHILCRASSCDDLFPSLTTPPSPSRRSHSIDTPATSLATPPSSQKDSANASAPTTSIKDNMPQVSKSTSDAPVPTWKDDPEASAMSKEMKKRGGKPAIAEPLENEPDFKKPINDNVKKIIGYLGQYDACQEEFQPTVDALIDYASTGRREVEPLFVPTGNSIIETMDNLACSIESSQADTTLFFYEQCIKRMCIAFLYVQ